MKRTYTSMNCSVSSSSDENEAQVEGQDKKNNPQQFLEIVHLLTCPLCLEVCNLPVSLGCKGQHMMCLKCFLCHRQSKYELQMQEYKLQYVKKPQTKIKCPVCKDNLKHTFQEINRHIKFIIDTILPLINQEFYIEWKKLQICDCGKIHEKPIDYLQCLKFNFPCPFQKECMLSGYSNRSKGKYTYIDDESNELVQLNQHLYVCREKIDCKLCHNSEDIGEIDYSVLIDLDHQEVDEQKEQQEYSLNIIEEQKQDPTQESSLFNMENLDKHLILHRNYDRLWKDLSHVSSLFFDKSVQSILLHDMNHLWAIWRLFRLELSKQIIHKLHPTTTEGSSYVSSRISSLTQEIGKEKEFKVGNQISFKSLSHNITEARLEGNMEAINDYLHEFEQEYAHLFYYQY